jgi:CubicO group peptidase (beta-lactamase class C family)
MKKSLLVVLLATCFGISHAEVAEVNPARHSGGLASDRNNRVFAPAKNVVPLPSKENMTWADKRIASEAERLIDNNKTTAILLIEKGKIVFEKYKEPATQNSPLFSQSMSKSLSAYTIGNMLCDGKIQSLNDPAKKYVPELAGTAPGDAPLRHVLSMSSGATDSIHAGEHERNEWTKIRTGQLSIKEVIVKHGAKEIESGKELRYSALDTFTLAHVANAAGGFFESFEKYVWQAAGTEAPGYWLYDKNGDAMTASGFSATGRDWARLAMFSVKQSKEQGCIGNFMKDATTAQVPNISKRIGQAFPGYGYQTWIGAFQGRHSYWWVGYGGQRVGIDPESERIIVLTSWREDYMADVYKLFGNWQRQ